MALAGHHDGAKEGKTLPVHHGGQISQLGHEEVCYPSFVEEKATASKSSISGLLKPPLGLVYQ